MPKYSFFDRSNPNCFPGTIKLLKKNPAVTSRLVDQINPLLPCSAVSPVLVEIEGHVGKVGVVVEQHLLQVRVSDQLLPPALVHQVDDDLAWNKTSQPEALQTLEVVWWCFLILQQHAMLGVAQQATSYSCSLTAPRSTSFKMKIHVCYNCFFRNYTF